jgi:hypothetical protein
MRKYLIGIAAILFPALPLYPRGDGFYLDWHNHVWMVGYFGEYFRQHHAMPLVFNTPEMAGLPQPIFYGYLFYPILGLFSMRLHPEVVVRLAALLLFAAQYVSVRKTLRRVGAAESLAATIACLTIWATYGLTNLYNRSALTEFFAAGLVTCAVCAWLDLLAATSLRAVSRRALRFGLLLTLAAGTHPITALYSLPLLAVLAVGLGPQPYGPGRLPRLTALVIAGVLSVAALAPWLWSVHRFGKDICMADFTNEVADLTDCIDHWTARLSPIPFDSRPLRGNPADVSTPYLDAPINIALLILGAGMLVCVLRGLKGGLRLRAAALVAVPLLYTAASLYFSLRPKDFDYLPRICLSVQFVYRLVTYVNLGLLLVPLFLLLWLRSRTPSSPTAGELASPVLLCFVLTLAGTGVLVKLVHAQVATIPEIGYVQYWAKFGRPFTHHVGKPHWLKNDSDRQALVHLPLSYPHYYDYTTPRWLRMVNPGEEPAVQLSFLGVDWHNGRFGDCQAAVIRRDTPGLAATEVAAFPWNRIYLDGQEVPPEQLRAWKPDKLAPWNGAYQIIVPVPAGLHWIEHRFVPDRTWRCLHRVAWLVLLGWIGVVICSILTRSLLKRRLKVEPQTKVANRFTFAPRMIFSRNANANTLASSQRWT